MTKKQKKEEVKNIMNKLKVVAVSALAALLCYMGWLAYWCKDKDDNGRGLYSSGNVMHRIALPLPCPPVCGQEQVITNAARTAPKVNGRQIVITSKGNALDSERHDMGHVLARAERGLTQHTHWNRE